MSKAKTSKVIRPDETKREKFVRLGEARIEKALKYIRMLGNLSNDSAYEYEEEDLVKINAAILNGLKEMMLRFTEPAKPEVFKF